MSGCYAVSGVAVASIIEWESLTYFIEELNVSRVRSITSDNFLDFPQIVNQIHMNYTIKSLLHPPRVHGQIY